MGHMVDDLGGKRIGQERGIPINAIPQTGSKDDPGRIYNDLNRRDWRFEQQERTGVAVAEARRTWATARAKSPIGN